MEATFGLGRVEDLVGISVEKHGKRGEFNAAIGRAIGGADEAASRRSLSIDWNRVLVKTKTDLKRLREYGLPADTAVFRVVQCSCEKATLYGNVDHLGHKERGDLISLVREIIEGRPPEIIHRLNHS